ncbi:MAG: hypothetical protein ACOVOW_10805, partial [Spirosomataceae bacterium]
TSSTGQSSTFEVISNTSTSLQLGMKKFTRSSPSDKFTPSDFTYFLDAVFGAYGIYGPKPSEAEVDAFLSYQGTYNYTK